MFRRFRLAALASATVLALGTLSASAVAGPKDAAAQKIDKDAMNNDFLMADFPTAEANLEKAVNTCGDSGCSPNVKAEILVHLGIVQTNQNKTAEAEKSFIQALELDSSVKPHPDFTTPEIEKVFEAAKGKASSGATGPTEPSPGEPATEQGEISHEPVVEQMINTPVPIWVTVPDTMPIGKVLVRYKPFGGSWKKLTLKKKRDGWGGIISCNDVTTTGDLKYYIALLDKAGDPITSLGSLNKPYSTDIKNQLDGEPPHLPHEPPPAQCAAKEDCPPGLPGCPAASERGDVGWGGACEETEECQEGLICVGGMCEEGEEEDDSPSGPYKKNWVGAYFSFDLAYVTGDDVCGRESQANSGYACFTREEENPYMPDGTQYHGDPIPSGSGNAIKGGFAPATARLMVGFDRVVWDNITVGARAGWAFRGGPQPDGGNAFLPFHLEARGQYFFGKDPFSRKGLRPFGFVAGGMAQVDTKVAVSVEEKNCAPGSAPDAPQGACVVPDNDNNDFQYHPPKQEVDAWRKAGQSFVALGGGAIYALNADSGVALELKLSYMLPTPNIVVSPTIGFVHGF